MKKMPAFFYPLLCTLMFSFTGQAQIFQTSSATVDFKSNAPLELIEAKSVRLKGAIDTQKKTFAFSIPIQSFQGFNSALQREHFNENYLESHTFPNATFTGKIIEDLDFNKEGTYTVRAKGRLFIHGVEQERIIKSKLQIKDGQFVVNADFSVLLEEHQIRIPKVVYQKIAEEIAVHIEATFEQ
jgi:polyisoprenoid-binding protein YceI